MNHPHDCEKIRRSLLTTKELLPESLKEFWNSLEYLNQAK